MPWNNRIKEAAYTSPSGTRFTFTYEDVSKSVTKKTAAFNFPDTEGTYIQDNGKSGNRLPMRFILWGDDYDLEADALEAGLLETGVGVLEHPIYGTFDVIAFGEIGRRDDLKTAANQAIITATLWETTRVVFPTAQTDKSGEVLGSVDAFNDAAAAQFDDMVDLASVVEKNTLATKFLSFVAAAEGKLQDIANAQDDVRRKYDSINKSIKNSMDVLINDPLTLATQTTQLLQAPSRSVVSIRARLDAYGGLIGGIVDSLPFVPSTDSRPNNEFITRDLYAMTYVTCGILASVNNEFETKTSAIEAAEAILAFFDTSVAYRDPNYASLEMLDTGGAYQKLQQSVALAAGFLVDISFSLKQERFITLTSPRTMIDLVAELYGSVDENLDFFINSNELTGSEILEIPKGRKIVYYV